MKAAVKYFSIFLSCFIIAGAISYYAVQLFTKSAEEVILPQLTGKNILYVLETLTQMGLNAKLHGTLYDETVPTYAVLSQDPPPGTTIKKGRDVVLFISKGKKENIIPDLRHLSQSEAVIALEKNEFKTAPMSYTWSGHVAENHVMAQYPRPFSTAVKGTDISLLISRGMKPEPLVMPDITGMTMLSATARLESLNLHAKLLESRFSEDNEPDIVLSQSPPAGSYVLLNDPIVMTVNNRLENIKLSPEFIGQLKYFKIELEPGFRKRHVRVETDLFGSRMDLYDKFYSPGEDVSFLVPVEHRMTFNVYVDEQLENTITLDPWIPGNTTGDISWELLPLQFYPQTLQDLEMN